MSCRPTPPYTFPMARSPIFSVAAAFVVAAVIAGCGSSKPASTITVGAEPTGSQSSAAASAPAPAPTQTAPAPAAAVPTPTSGPLSKEPKVTAPNGAAPTTLVSKDIIKGTGPVAKAGQMVTVNYVGVLFDGGKPFDASWNRKQTFAFPLGQGQVIPGWDQGVPGMKVGGRRELIIPAKLAYGAQGQPPTIPPNAPLVFVIDLLAV
jgi:peptidylprolyl isomerase